jgi:hypothetical protein
MCPVQNKSKKNMPSAKKIEVEQAQCKKKSKKNMPGSEKSKNMPSLKNRRRTCPVQNKSKMNMPSAKQIEEERARCKIN